MGGPPAGNNAPNVRGELRVRRLPGVPLPFQPEGGAQLGLPQDAVGIPQDAVGIPQGFLQNFIGSLVVRFLGHGHHLIIYYRSKSPYFQ